MVGDDRQEEEVLYGKQGILEGMQKGTVITMGTYNPGLVQELSQKAKDRINVLDAPVSGGVTEARAASLTIPVGGERQVFDQYRPVLEAMGKSVIYRGDLGSRTGGKMDHLHDR
jgi:3-hydroxyisobutyrate dehydrogenase